MVKVLGSQAESQPSFTTLAHPCVPRPVTSGCADYNYDVQMNQTDALGADAAQCHGLRGYTHNHVTFFTISKIDAINYIASKDATNRHTQLELQTRDALLGMHEHWTTILGPTVPAISNYASKWHNTQTHHYNSSSDSGLHELVSVSDSDFEWPDLVDTYADDMMVN